MLEVIIGGVVWPFLLIVAHAVFAIQTKPKKDDTEEI